MRVALGPIGSCPTLEPSSPASREGKRRLRAAGPHLKPLAPKGLEGVSPMRMRPLVALACSATLALLFAATSAHAVCGDTILDVGEQCDDGNLIDGDGCDSNCSFTACGNTIVT